MSAPQALTRRLGLADAVTVGLGAMLGAGVFVALGPATAAAGSAVMISLGLAGALAWLNADSSARLAMELPTSGGAYTWARVRCAPWAGTAAGLSFLVGKTCSVAAIATTAGAYLWPTRPRVVAVGAVLVLTALAAGGVQRSARVTRWVVALVLVTLGAVVVGALLAGQPPLGAGATGMGTSPGPVAVLQGAGVLFFAFAGYARIATLGEEVVDPRRTLPRAIAAALTLVIVTYAAVGLTVLSVLGPDRLAASTRPVAAAVDVLGWPGWAAGAVAGVAAVAALASALGVLLGLSRTTLAMARDGVLPHALALLDGPPGEPRPVRAQVTVGLAAALVALAVDLAVAISLSSAAVLAYYAFAHAAALTLPGAVRRLVPVLGLAGCAVVAGTLLLRL